MRCPDPIFPRRAAAGAALALALLAGGCGMTEGGGAASSGGSTLANLIKYGSTTEPPIQRAAGDVEAAYCPQVLVISGRSAVRHGSAQVSISQIARECVERPDGSVVVKVGIEGLALLGPGGGGGRFDVPVVFQITQGDRVIVNRTRRAAVAIGGGAAQGSFTVIEGGMVVPAKSGAFDIQVGLGGGGPARHG
ncbi:hypothetical protein [Enterovirga sp.]|uniref:hypothetical protein n=1 Tax=Enterovirga sp. TaxID=2026350 RepID=UPI002B62DE04|nr:hypothetical protein [Enterovirga sp.]HMO31085.1 hypothetical protein [Enterovirga sp.]